MYWRKKYYDSCAEQLLKHLEEEKKIEYDLKDIAIIASNKAGLTKQMLIDVDIESGLMGVYNLGMKHMYKYMKGDNDK